MRRIVIVGNGPVGNIYSDFVDQSDCVIRFNIANEHEGKTGSKTDILFLANARVCIQDFISQRKLVESSAFKNCRSVFLPKHPYVLENYTRRKTKKFGILNVRNDATRESIDYFGKLGKSVTVLPTSFFADCCAALGLSLEPKMQHYPSTGFMGVFYACGEYCSKAYSIELIGFGWDGWAGHPWQSEEAWMVSNANLNIHG